MAIVLGSKLVKDLSENAHVAIGITLPFRRGNNGFFAQSYQTIEQVKSNINNFSFFYVPDKIDFTTSSSIDPTTVSVYTQTSNNPTSFLLTKKV